MLVKVTTQCTMGCPHCMEDAMPRGEHMDMEVFRQTIKFIERMNKYPLSRTILLSGGEPTEHPQLYDFLNLLSDWFVTICSNGMFLKEQKHPLLKIAKKQAIVIQVSADHRYYSKKIAEIIHPQIQYCNTISTIAPIGRAKNNRLPASRRSPFCFNLRSICNSLRSFTATLAFLRKKGYFCTPSIDAHGNVLAGESRFCHKIGTVESSDEELTQSICSMRCNACGLEDNLSSIEKAHIH
jgi:hypothetical protein